MKKLDFDSIVFEEVTYCLKDNHLIVNAKENGSIALHRRNLSEFISELLEIKNVYGDIRT